MAQQSQPSTYTQGYSDCTLATHLRRVADSDAAFLLPHIKKTDRILDVGCGPGTITTGFAKYASEGSIVGVDISPDVLKKATALAAEAGIPTEGPGSVVFEQGNILARLPYPDDSFDVVFSSQLLPHLPPPDRPVQALTEMRRVLKPGGILASRTGVVQHFFPRRLDLERLWVQNQSKVLFGAAPDAEQTGANMPALLRSVGFDVDGGKVQVGAGTRVLWEAKDRQWLAWRGTGTLQPGDPFHQGWLDAGISEDEIQETLRAIEEWAATEDAWHLAVQSEVLAWK